MALTDLFKPCLHALDLLVYLIYLVKNVFAQLCDHFERLVLYLFVSSGYEMVWIVI